MLATTELWKRYMVESVGVNHPYQLAQAHHWLATIGRILLLNLDGSPTFWLHALHWIDEDGRLIRRALTVSGIVGAVIGGGIGLLFLSIGVMWTLPGLGRLPSGHQVVVGAFVGLVIGRGFLSRMPVSLKITRVLRPTEAAVTSASFVCALITGLYAIFSDVLFGLIVGILSGLVSYVVVCITQPVDDAVRNAIGPRGPYAVLIESARSGLSVGLLYLTIALLAGGILRYAAGQQNLLLLNTLLYQFAVAFAFALIAGVSAVIWHLILRLMLAHRNDLPRHLLDFLMWTTLPERGWMNRVGGGFRFRHREFQEFLIDHDPYSKHDNERSRSILHG